MMVELLPLVHGGPLITKIYSLFLRGQKRRKRHRSLFSGGHADLNISPEKEPGRNLWNTFFFRQVFANLRGAGTFSSGGFAKRLGFGGRGGNFWQG